MESCPEPLQPLEGERSYWTSSRALVCMAGLALSLSCLFLTVLQQCAGREILALLCLVMEKPVPKGEASRSMGCCLKSGGSPITERDVTSPSCPRLLHPPVHIAGCVLGEDKSLDEKPSLPP